MSRVIYVVFFYCSVSLKVFFKNYKKNVKDRYLYVGVFTYLLKIPFINVVFHVRLIHIHLKVLEIFARQIVGATKSVRCKYCQNCSIICH